MYRFGTELTAIVFALEHMPNKLLTALMVEERTRALVLRNEGARHPFRLTLPRNLLEVAASELEPEQISPKAHWMNEDVHLFLFSFTAFFTAFYLFIF